MSDHYKHSPVNVNHKAAPTSASWISAINETRTSLPPMRKGVIQYGYASLMLALRFHDLRGKQKGSVVKCGEATFSLGGFGDFAVWDARTDRVFTNIAMASVEVPSYAHWLPIWLTGVRRGEDIMPPFNIVEMGVWENGKPRFVSETLAAGLAYAKEHGGGLGREALSAGIAHARGLAG